MMGSECATGEESRTETCDEQHNRGKDFDCLHAIFTLRCRRLRSKAAANRSPALMIRLLALCEPAALRSDGH